MGVGDWGFRGRIKELVPAPCASDHHVELGLGLGLGLRLGLGLHRARVIITLSRRASATKPSALRPLART